MATIRTVADLAGVSTATVSHVINETRVVSAPLTARVHDAMEQLTTTPTSSRAACAAAKPSPSACSCPA